MTPGRRVLRRGLAVVFVLCTAGMALGSGGQVDWLVQLKDWVGQKGSDPTEHLYSALLKVESRVCNLEKKLLPDGPDAARLCPAGGAGYGWTAPPPPPPWPLRDWLGSFKDWLGQANSDPNQHLYAAFVRVGGAVTNLELKLLPAQADPKRLSRLKGAQYGWTPPPPPPPWPLHEWLERLQDWLGETSSNPDEHLYASFVRVGGAVANLEQRLLPANGPRPEAGYGWTPPPPPPAWPLHTH